MARPVIVAEDDPFMRLVGVVLDPATAPERIAAFADFFSVDLSDFDGWLKALRSKAARACPAEVRLVESERHSARTSPTPTP